MKGTIKKIAVLLAALITKMPAVSAQTTYIVQPGDTLSHILNESFNVSPLYGKNGAINHVLAINPHLDSADRILPGNKIVIPFRIDEENEISAKMELIEATESRVSQESNRGFFTVGATTGIISSSTSSKTGSASNQTNSLFGLGLKYHHSESNFWIIPEVSIIKSSYAPVPSEGFSGRNLNNISAGLGMVIPFNHLNLNLRSTLNQHTLFGLEDSSAFASQAFIGQHEISITKSIELKNSILTIKLGALGVTTRPQNPSGFGVSGGLHLYTGRWSFGADVESLNFRMRSNKYSEERVILGVSVLVGN